MRLAGHVVLVEYDGDSGYASIKRDKPDLVLLDWMMPRMSGIEVCVAVRADPDCATTPIILVTARAQESDIGRGFAAGADDYIVKPFSPLELISRVDALLARTSR